jgi:hypothetical protein
MTILCFESHEFIEALIKRLPLLFWIQIFLEIVMNLISNIPIAQQELRRIVYW